MIISCAPARITLGGGGTDLPSYYSKYGGFLIADAIDSYVYISIHKRFQKDIRLVYSNTEMVNDSSQIKHPILREAFKLLGIEGGIEVFSMADVPAGFGLGSSGSFTVALLNALHVYEKEFVTQKQLAEEACHIEIDILKEPIGKQDQYISAFGGVTCFTFDTNGEVLVEPLRMTDEALHQLENNLLFFYTAMERSASEVLREQDEKSKNNDAEVLNNLHQIKEIGLKSKELLEKGQLDEFGGLMDAHWQTKRKLSSKVSNPFIDECYEVARKSGALGGKIMGAGGGGFFMFYCSGDKSRLIASLKEKGLTPAWFRFDFGGVKTLLNMRCFW